MSGKVKLGKTKDSRTRGKVKIVTKGRTKTT
jgi:hypothetical protein